MASESNNMNDGATSYQPSEPVLCANGCGFFGTAATMNMCSKCYNSFSLEEEQQAAAKAVLDKIVNPVPSPSADFSHVDGPDSFTPLLVKPSTSAAAAEEHEKSSPSATAAPVVVKISTTTNRCLICKKKVGVIGFNCRCGCTFCGVHRYPEKHDCNFDFKSQGREAIAKANPIVKGDKIQRF